MATSQSSRIRDVTTTNQVVQVVPSGKVKSAYEPSGPSGRSLSRFP